MAFCRCYYGCWSGSSSGNTPGPGNPSLGGRMPGSRNKRWGRKAASGFCGFVVAGLRQFGEPVGNSAVVEN